MPEGQLSSILCKTIYYADMQAYSSTCEGS